MITVYYTKRFTAGLLKDLAVNCACSFTDKGSAYRFAKHYQDRTKVHKDVLPPGQRFQVVDLSFQKYDRS